MYGYGHQKVYFFQILRFCIVIVKVHDSTIRLNKKALFAELHLNNLEGFWSNRRDHSEDV